MAPPPAHTVPEHGIDGTMDEKARSLRDPAILQEQIKRWERNKAIADPPRSQDEIDAAVAEATACFAIAMERQEARRKSAGGTAQASREMTREVNLKNELEAARRATQSGGKMLVVKPPPDAEVEVRGPKPKKNPKQQPVVKVPYRF